MEPTLNDEMTLLKMNSKAYKLAMEKQLEFLSIKTRKATTVGLLTGGILVLGVFVYKKLFTRNHYIISNTNLKNELLSLRPKKESFLITMVKEQMVLFLFSIAKNKIESLLKSIESKSKSS